MVPTLHTETEQGFTLQSLCLTVPCPMAGIKVVGNNSMLLGGQQRVYVGDLLLMVGWAAIYRKSRVSLQGNMATTVITLRDSSRGRWIW